MTYSHDASETTSDSFDFLLADGGEDGALPIAGTFNIVVTLVNDNVIDLPPADLAIRESEEQFFQLSGSRETVGVVLSYSPQLEQLERLLREDLAQAIVWAHWDQTQTQEQATAMVYAGVAGAGMSVFSIGYVFWALRGGALMTVFASSLPAWRFIDPISMLSAYRSSQTDSDEGLESLLDRGP